MNPLVMAPLGAALLLNATWGRRRPRPPAPGAFVDIAGGRIHYRERPGEGLPVLMLHGMPGTHLDFERVSARLDGARTIAIDRPGYGWSTGAPLSYRRQIDLVPRFLQALGIERALLVGHSFGGLLALGVARLHPSRVASLVLVAPSGGGLRSGPVRLAVARTVAPMQMPLVRQALAVSVGGLFRRTAAEIDLRFAFAPDPPDAGYRERLDAVTLQDDGLRAMARDRLNYNGDIEWIDAQLPLIDRPSVTVLATGDQPIPIEHGRRLAAALPGTELVEVPGGHMLPYTQPGVVADAITRAVTLASRAG